MVYNGIIISLGTASFVAHSIGGTIDNYTYIPAFGFGMAAATLVGISLGEEDVAKPGRSRSSPTGSRRPVCWGSAF
jgi:Na+-driven multidrug efflux pump